MRIMDHEEINKSLWKVLMALLQSSANRQVVSELNKKNIKLTNGYRFLLEREESSRKEEIILENGKYRFYVRDYLLYCDRYNEPYREFIGNKAVHALFNECLNRRDELCQQS